MLKANGVEGRPSRGSLRRGGVLGGLRERVCSCGGGELGRLRVRDVWKHSDCVVRIRECERCGARYVSEERLVGRATKRTIRR